MNDRRNFLATTLGLALSGAAGAQTAASDRPVQIVVGFPPGQSVDLVARLLAPRLADALGRPVVVENRPGQGGSLALAALAKMPADGSALTLSALASLVANPHLYRNVRYDTLNDFQPIGLVYDAPLVLVVNPALPVKNVGELVAYAKARPRELSHSSSGNGTVSHLGMVDFQRRAGIEIVHVPYQGSTPAMTDLVGGRVQVGMDTVAAVLPHVRGDRLRMIAACSGKRLALFPQQPTVAESGYPGFEAVAWIGLLGPAGLPRDFVDRVNAEVRKLDQVDEFQERMRTIGAQPRTSTPDEFATYLKSEYRKWGDLVKASGAKVD